MRGIAIEASEESVSGHCWELRTVRSYFTATAVRDYAGFMPTWSLRNRLKRVLHYMKESTRESELYGGNHDGPKWNPQSSVKVLKKSSAVLFERI